MNKRPPVKHGMLVSLLYRYEKKRLYKMVLSDLMSGAVAVNVTGHADSSIISDFIIILNICRSVLQVFFSYQCNKLSCRFERTSSDESNPIFPSWPGGFGHMLNISSVIDVHIYAIYNYPGVSLLVDVCVQVHCRFERRLA